MTEMWERFAFYGMKALLFLYLTQHHLFNDSQRLPAARHLRRPGLRAAAARRPAGRPLPGHAQGGAVRRRCCWCWASWAWPRPGDAAQRPVGQRRRDALAVQIMYLSLALIGVGVGFLKPNISTIVGRLYADNDPRRDSGFTIFYMGINVGAALSSLIVGYIGMNVGWGYGFGLSGVMMALGLVQFIWGQKHLLGQAEPADPAMLRDRCCRPVARMGDLLSAAWSRSWWSGRSCRRGSTFGPLSALAGGHEVTLTEVVAVVMGAALCVWFVRLLLTGISSVDKRPHDRADGADHDQRAVLGPVRTELRPVGGHGRAHDGPHHLRHHLERAADHRFRRHLRDRCSARSSPGCGRAWTSSASIPAIRPSSPGAWCSAAWRSACWPWRRAIRAAMGWSACGG